MPASRSFATRDPLTLLWPLTARRRRALQGAGVLLGAGLGAGLGGAGGLFVGGAVALWGTKSLRAVESLGALETAAGIDPEVLPVLRRVRARGGWLTGVERLSLRLALEYRHPRLALTAPPGVSVLPTSLALLQGLQAWVPFAPELQVEVDRWTRELSGAGFDEQHQTFARTAALRRAYPDIFL